MGHDVGSRGRRIGRYDELISNESFGEDVLVQLEMEKRRSPLVSIRRSGGDFQGMGSFDPMEVGRRKNELSRPVHRLDEPAGKPSASLRPRCPLPFRPAKSL
jgi:hypothetical protein